MSTRVRESFCTFIRSLLIAVIEKGSQKFKPVVKSRVRAEGTPAPKPSPNPPSAGLATGSSKPSSKKGGAANLLAIESATSTHNVAEEVVIGDDCVSSARAERPPLLSKARNGTSPGNCDSFRRDKYANDLLLELQDLPDLVQHARAVHTRSNDSGSSTYVLEEQTLPMISNATTENRDSNPELASSFPEAAGSLPGADTIHGSPSAPETAPGQEIPLSVRSANEMGTTADNGRRTSSRLRTKGAVSYVSAEENGGNGPSERGSKVAIEIEDTVAAEDSSSASEDDVVVPRKTRKKRKRDVDAQDEPEPRPRRRRKAKTANFLDEDAAPGEDLDPTTITMADICEDTGQGRISSKAAAIQKNHLEWKNANRAKRERMRAIMEAKKYGRKEDDTAPVQEAVRESDGEEGASQADATNETPGPEEIAEDGFDYRQTLPSNRFNAQVRIGANGETIIDEESLFVERADQDDAAQQYQHVEESDATKFTNSATYAKKIRSSRWSGEETELFFHVGFLKDHLMIFTFMGLFRPCSNLARIMS